MTSSAVQETPVGRQAAGPTACSAKAVHLYRRVQIGDDRKYESATELHAKGAPQRGEAFMTRILLLAQGTGSRSAAVRRSFRGARHGTGRPAPRIRGALPAAQGIVDRHSRRPQRIPTSPAAGHRSDPCSCRRSFRNCSESGRTASQTSPKALRQPRFHSDYLGPRTSTEPHTARPLMLSVWPVCIELSWRRWSS
jgi:hypothetical protein